MKKLGFFMLALYSLTVLAAAGYAQEPVTLASLLKTAREGNPELRAAKEKLSAAQQKVTREKTWDDPKLSLEYWTIPEGSLDISRANEKMYGVSQMIPFPGKLSAKGGIAGGEAEEMKWEYKNTELNVLSELQTAYSRYVYVIKALRTYHELADLMNSFSKVSESRYIAGKTSQTEVLRAQVESEKMSNMTITLEQEKQTMQAEINRLIGKNADEKLGDPQEVPLVYLSKSWEEIKSLTINNSPEIGRSKAGVVKSEAAKRLARFDYLPDFDIAYRKKTLNNEPEGSDVMFGFTIPLWFWKQHAGVKEARYELDAAESDKKNRELTAVSQAQEAFAKLDAAHRLIELYKNSIIPKSEQSLTVAQSQTGTGQLSFLEFLDISRAYLEFNLEYYELITQYQENLAVLEKVTGTELYDGGNK
jgi:cobalt-zinc-cadmium efflux system outer membrane protein